MEEAINNKSFNLKELWNSEGAGFVLKLVLVYGLWKVLYLGLSTPGWFIHSAWLQAVGYLCNFYAWLAYALLKVIGQGVHLSGAYVFFAGTGKSFSVAEHCLAIPAMVIFTMAIALFQGPVKSKLWFIPLGIFLIFLINLLRIAFLGYTLEHFSWNVYKLSHNYIYVVFTYALILAMIIWWMRKNRPVPVEV